MPKHFIVLPLYFIFLIVSLTCGAQPDKQNTGDNPKPWLPAYKTGVTLDYQALKHISYSLSFGLMSYAHDYKDKTKCSWLLTTEYMPKDNSLLKDVYGFKIGGYFGSWRKFFDLGYAFAYFTNFSKYRVAFVPEVGIGYKSFFIVYRRNLTLFKNGLDNLNKDNISLRVYIPLDKRWFKL